MVAHFITPQPKSAGWTGKITAALGAVFLVAVSYMTLKTAVTPDSAGRAVSDDPSVSVDGLKKLSPGERGDAEQAARQAFARDPLDARAVLDLSIFAETAGNAEAAERLRLSAGDMTPRATRIQAEALLILLKRRDFDQVMSRLDGLIRARPAEAKNFFALAAEISADDAGAKAVARMLASNPPWRRDFFASLRTKGQPETASRIMDEIRAMGDAVDDTEVAGLINDYLKNGAFDKAYAVWLSNLSEEELRDVKRIYDGGFTHPIRNLRFDWTVKPADGLIYRLFPRNTASMDQTLQFDFVDFTGTFTNLSQILRLRPGRYQLAGEVRFEDFESPAGMVFRLYCLDSAGRPKALDATSPLPQSTQWIGFDKVFTIPPSACDNQILQLESQFRLDKSQFTRGMVALDGINIDNLPGLAP